MLVRLLLSLIVCDVVYDGYMIFSTGFDLMEVGRDEVTLRTGKQANKRNIQFAHQALLALFGKYCPQ